MKQLTLIQKVISPDDLKDIDLDQVHIVMAPNVVLIKGKCFNNLQQLRQFVAPNLRMIESGSLNKCIALFEFFAPRLKEVSPSCFEDSYCLSFITIQSAKINACTFSGMDCLRTIVLHEQSDCDIMKKNTCISASTKDLVKNRESKLLIQRQYYHKCKQLGIADAIGQNAKEYIIDHILIAPPITKTLATNGNFRIQHIYVFIGQGVTRILYKSFAFAEKLYLVIAPNLEYVAEGAFYNCHQLREVVANKIEEVKDEAFIGCILLANFNFQNIRTLGKSSFACNQSLFDVRLNKVQEIPEFCFRNCNALSQIVAFLCTKICVNAFNAFSQSFQLRIHAPKAEESIQHIIQQKGLQIVMITEQQIVDQVTFQTDQEFSYYKWKTKTVSKKLKYQQKICKAALKILQHNE